VKRTPEEKLQYDRERVKAWRLKNPERFAKSNRAAGKRFYAAHPERVKERARKRRLAHPEEVKAAGRAQVRAWRLANPEKYAAQMVHDNTKARSVAFLLRQETIAAYGGKCNCCKESLILLLNIDHVESREKNGSPRGGSTLWRWLRDHGFPPGFQVLCWNCNIGRYLNGGVCPHQTAEGMQNLGLSMKEK
jgi:hypothetical protein